MKRIISLLLITIVLFSACDESIDVYTVTYNYGDDSRSPESVQVQNGAMLNKPDDPSRDGHVFKGWYKENGDLFDFSTPVTEDMRLNAKWSPAWTVTLLFHGAGPDLTFLVEKDVGTLSLPKYTEIFKTDVEWYAEGSIYPFVGNVTNDLTLSPKGEDGYVLTNDNTYIVYSAGGLKEWANAAQTVIPSPNCTLANNISNVSWTPVGESVDYPYGGTFDGRGHTIGNLTINNTHASLFGYLTGTVKNLRLNNVKLTSSYNGSSHVGVGAIAAYADGSVIENCEIVNADITLNVASSSREMTAGGIAGRAMSSRIEGCTFEGDIKATVESGFPGKVYIGGIVGIAGLEGSEADIIASSASGTYSCTDISSSRIGGLAGRIVNARLIGSYSMADARYGLAGEIDENVSPTIDSCYFTSSVMYPSLIINADAKIGKLDTTSFSTMEAAKDEMNKALEREKSKYRFSDNIISSESGDTYDESQPFVLGDV